MSQKVLLCVESLDPNYGGPAYSVRRLGESLAVLGTDVGLWAFDGSGQTLDADLKRQGCTRLSGDFETALSTFGRPDIVHDNSIWRLQNHQIATACSRAGITRVVSTRGMLEPWSLAHKWVKKRLAWIAYQKRDLNRAQLLHATAYSEAAAIAKLELRTQVVVIPNGVDLPIPSDRKLPCKVAMKPRTALFLSRVHPKKGLDMLIEAWARLRPDGWRLRIVGPGEDAFRDEIITRIARAGLIDHISLEGPLYDEAKSVAYAEADLFILPSHSENFGVVIAEALAHGVPVLTTTGTPWQALRAEDSGWWVPPTTDAVMAALADATSQPPERLAAMGARGRIQVENDFAWAGIAARMLHAYNDFSERHPN